MLARVLVAVLTGVFDPPPSALTVPWSYLALLAVAVVGSIAVACTVVLGWARRASASSLRDG